MRARIPFLRIAAVSCATLLIASCTPDSEQPPTSGSEGGQGQQEEAAPLATPDAFDTSNGSAWPAVPITGDVTALSSDRTHLAFATGAGGPDGDEVTVTQVDLTTGKTITADPVPAAIDGGEDGAPYDLRYTADGLALLTNSDDGTWQATAYPIGKSTATTTEAGALADGEPAVFAEDSVGALVDTGQELVLVDTEEGTTQTLEVENDVTLTGCKGSGDCTGSVAPLGELGGQQVTRSTTPSGSGEAQCTFGGACVETFTVGDWSTADEDVAPDGARNEMAQLYAANDEYAIVRWKPTTPPGDMYRLIDLKDPTAEGPEWTCGDESGQAEDPIRPLATSPSGTFLAAGQVAVSTETGIGSCLQNTGPADFVAINEDGTAWIQSPDQTPSKASENASKTAALSSLSKGEALTAESLSGAVYLPSAVLDIGGKQTGVFLGTPEGGDTPIVAAYPAAG